MSDAISLNEFLSLGQSLCIVANPQPWHADLVTEEIGKFLDRLTACGMTRARIAAKPLDGRKITYDIRSGSISGGNQRELRSCMESIVETLYAEAQQKQVVVINSGAVSQKLRDISQFLTLTQSQEHLSDETVCCLERSAHRAAIVMGWCFAYDIARRWVYDDQRRLQTFNSELASYTKRNGARQYDDIADYEDFFSYKAPAEGRVIEICENSGLIAGKIARKLRHYLDVRNDYAHATSSHPTENQAIAFIENLLDIITTSPYLQPS